MRARSGIAGKLVNGGERNSRMPRDDGFRAVAVVRVEIPDGDLLDSLRERIERRDRDAAEVTETHRLRARGMMTRRPHEAETPLAGDRSTRDLHGGARSACRMFVDLRMSGRVGIEILECRAH